MNQGFVAAKLKPSLRKCYNHHHAFVNRYRISVSPNDLRYTPFVVITIPPFPLTGYLTGVSRRVSKVDQELSTLPEHRSFCGVRFAQS